MMNLDDTIAALSTTPGPSGVAVVKVSGPNAYTAARKVFQPKSKIGRWPARKMIYGQIIGPEKNIIDEGLAVYMPAPASYTRQDVVEIQTHGGRAASAAVLDTLAVAGVRMAEPGEFTRRAFLLGRIDLVQAEAVLDIVSAQTKAGLIAAQRQLSGVLSGRIGRLREELVEVKALLEANIDFPDEEIGELDHNRAIENLGTIMSSLETLLETYSSGRLYHQGATCVIAGRPNVGKSSLLNTLLQQRRAIVTPSPGTTRDAIEATANIQGIPFRLIDTAGIRESSDPIEGEGVKITREQIETADLVLAMWDAFEGLTGEDESIRAELEDRNVLFVANKIDLLGAADYPVTDQGKSETSLVSAKTGSGIDELCNAMVNAVRGADVLASDEAILTNARHKQLIQEGLIYLQKAVTGLMESHSPELIAVEIEDGSRKLGQIIGDTTPDDVLNHIFSRFCIGK